MKLSLQKCIAEYFGSFMLVFVGTGAIVVNDLASNSITYIGVALAFGLVVLTVVYTYGDISGAHINPAVTIGFWLAKRLPGKIVLPYVSAQLFGAITGSLFIFSIAPNHPNLGATLPKVAVWQAFLLEVIITWWLMTVILRVSHGAKEKGIVAGLVIGGAVAFSALLVGPLTGASMNPARSFGPSLIANEFNGWWIYIFAPILGSSLSVITCRLTSEKHCCTAC